MVRNDDLHMHLRGTLYHISLQLSYYIYSARVMLRMHVVSTFSQHAVLTTPSIYIPKRVQVVYGQRHYIG